MRSVVLFACWLLVCVSMVEAYENEVSSWTRNLSLIYSGEGNKFLRDCDCSPNVYTNLAPRDQKIERLIRDQQHVVLLDLGRVSTGNTPTDQHRSQAYLEQLRSMSYNAVLLTSQEFVHGLGFVFENADTGRLISTNVVCTNQETPWLSKILIDASGVRVGVLGLTGKPLNSSEYRGLQWLPTLSVAHRGVLDLQAHGAEVIVCMSDLGAHENQEVLANIEGIDILLTPHATEEFAVVGQTLLASGVQTGEMLGEIKMSVTPNHNEIISHQLHLVLPEIVPVAPFRHLIRKVGSKLVSSQ